MAIDYEAIINKLLELSIGAGKHLLWAALVFFVGRYIVKLINRFVSRMLIRSKVDVGVQSFVGSMVNILLLVLLIISVISALGVNTTSFAAILASAGVAIGMALSGNLQNVAGGLIVLIFRPYRVGDLIEVGGTLGTVEAIQIFHTIVRTPDNLTVYLPNGTTSSGSVINYSRQDTRRLDWTFGVAYGSDFQKARAVVEQVIRADKRILADPTPYIGLTELADSSVNILVRVWVNSADFYPVTNDVNLAVYNAFNENGVEFPFPSRTVYIHKET